MSTPIQTDSVRRSIAAAERELAEITATLRAHESDRKRASDFCQRMSIDPGDDPVAAIGAAATTRGERIAAAEGRLAKMAAALDATLTDIAAARDEAGRSGHP